MLENKPDINSVMRELLYKLVNGLKTIYGNELKKVIVYGSYARGQGDEESDLDIMVLVNFNAEEIRARRNDVLDLVVVLTTRYGKVLSILENNYEYYYEWIDVLPFFKNVEREGICIYERK